MPPHSWLLLTRSNACKPCTPGTVLTAAALVSAILDRPKRPHLAPPHPCCPARQVGSLYMDVGQRYDVLVCAREGVWASEREPPPVWIRAGVVDSDKLPSTPVMAVLHFGDKRPAQLPATQRACKGPRLTPIPYSDGTRDFHPNNLPVSPCAWRCFVRIAAGRICCSLPHRSLPHRARSLPHRSRSLPGPHLASPQTRDTHPPTAVERLC